MGYGDISSSNDLERGFAIVGMIIGATVFGYIIGNVAVIMENFDVVDAIETSKMNQIKDWLYDRKVGGISQQNGSMSLLTCYFFRVLRSITYQAIVGVHVPIKNEPLSVRLWTGIKFLLRILGYCGRALRS